MPSLCSGAVRVMGRPLHKVESKALFGNNGKCFASYKKSTFHGESLNNMRGYFAEIVDGNSLLYNSLGRWKIEREYEDKNMEVLSGLFVRNFVSQICYDFGFCKSKSNINIQLVQSNSFTQPNNEIPERNKSKYIIYCDAKLSDSNVPGLYKNDSKSLESVNPYNNLDFVRDGERIAIKIHQIERHISGATIGRVLDQADMFTTCGCF
jgi:hypothetical protein